jgi:hypothetical protein
MPSRSRRAQVLLFAALQSLPRHVGNSTARQRQFSTTGISRRPSRLVRSRHKWLANACTRDTHARSRRSPRQGTWSVTEGDRAGFIEGLSEAIRCAHGRVWNNSRIAIPAPTATDTCTRARLIRDVRCSAPCSRSPGQLNCCKSARVENGAFEVSGPVDLVVDGWPEAALHEGALQDEFFHTPRSRIPALRRKSHVGLVLRASGLDLPEATGRRPLVAEGTFDIVC